VMGEDVRARGASGFADRVGGRAAGVKVPRCSGPSPRLLTLIVIICGRMEET